MILEKLRVSLVVILRKMQIERVGRHGNSQIYDSLGESSLARGSYIEHRVSKWDTLAGVAIKYGVEVADIKRLNGLVTDRQMFALKSLQIPLPGRHPPSPVLGKNSTSSGESNSEQTTPSCRDHIDILELLQSLKLKPSQKKVSSAMSTLQGYYGLASSDSRGAAEGTEMAVYKEGFVQYLDREKLPKASPVSDPPQTWHCKSRSLVSSVSSENGESIDDLPSSEAGDIDSENSNNIPVRRRQKDDAGQNSPTPELIIKEDKTSGGFSGKTGKGLVLRPKLASWFTLATDSESFPQNPGPNGNSAFLSDMFACVRKSSSTSNLHGSDGSSTIWPTSKWSLKPDLQALSTPTTRRLIFDGLPKPITGWRSKAAVD